jgi:hypothetical protein
VTPPQQYPEGSESTTALVLGILGVVVCGILGPFAWYIGNREVKAIDEGRRDPTNRGSANAGKILGIVGTVFLGLGILVGIVVLLFVVVASTEVSSLS